MNYKAIIEGLLFISGEEGLSLDDLCNIIEKDKSEINEIIKDLFNDYKSIERGIQLEFLGEHFKLTTKAEHKDYYKKLVKEEEASPLSQSCLETLAIVAYNGPITRTEIEQIRGVNSSYVVRKLILKGLIKDVGKSEAPGKPRTYNITPKFLDYFGLGTAKELPNIDLNQSFSDIELDLFNSKYSE